MEEVKKLYPEIDIEKVPAVDAEYRKETVEKLIGNPMAEALPFNLSDDDLINLFTSLPAIEDEVNLDKEDRAACISCLRDILVPTAEYIDTIKALFRMLRVGYRNRNPLKFEDLKIIREQEKLTSQNYSKKAAQYEIEPNKSSIQENMTIIGLSGVGKTTTINTFKRVLPRAIRHKKYKGKDLDRIQIPVLHVIAPADGRLEGLLLSILKALDEALGIGNTGADKCYYAWAVVNGIPKNQLMLEVAKICQNFSVGIIVIDEASNLANNYSQRKEVNSFITNMANVWQVPIVFVGTPKLETIMDKDLNVIRRMSAYGTRYWGQITKDSVEWKKLVKTIWKIQYTKAYTTVSDELIEALYEVSQGIISLVISIFMYVQLNCLYDEDNPDEIIRPEDILNTFEKDFKPMHNVIKAIKNDDISALQDFDNILIDINGSFDLTRAVYQESDYMTRMGMAARKAHNSSYKARIRQMVKDMDCFELPDSKINKIINKVLKENSYLIQEDNIMRLTGIAYSLLEKENKKYIEKRKKNKKKAKKTKIETSLLSIFDKRDKEKQTAYNLFKTNGYIEKKVSL